jgi:hypothetical protein
MSSELYWNHTPAGFVSLYCQKGELLVFFEGTINETDQRYFGHIALKQTLEQQSIFGTIEYKTLGREVERFPYHLVGHFQDESWEIFKGEWLESDDTYEFNAIFEPMSCVEDRQKELRAQWDYHDLFNSNINNSLTMARQKRVSPNLADPSMSISSVQRSMELSYGLPQGCVQLIYPDRSISLKTNVGKLRKRWMAEMKV